jgi:hypothetical protein
MDGREDHENELVSPTLASFHEITPRIATYDVPAGRALNARRHVTVSCAEEGGGFDGTHDDERCHHRQGYRPSGITSFLGKTTRNTPEVSLDIAHL